MGVRDYDKEANQTDEHVNDGEYTVDALVGVNIGEIIDGRDECIPWEEKSGAKREVDDVG